MDFFYDQQLRQYRLQVMRAFSNFSVRVGENADGTPKLRRVPCRYGDSSRIAEAIIAANSENKMPTVPFISAYVTGLALAPERRTSPSLVSTQNVIERDYDGELARYTNNSGNRYTVQRYMPVPYTLTLNVDIWTSNLDQKEQLLEQILILYNGMVDMQTSTNPLDWTALTVIDPQSINWSSRSIPIGTDNPIDVATIEIRVPIHLNPPAKVKHQAIIQQVVTSINDARYDEEAMEWTNGDLINRVITTPGNAGIRVEQKSGKLYYLTLTNQGGVTDDPDNLPTRVVGVSNPKLTPGTSFRFNGYAITVPNTNLTDLVSVIKQQINNLPLNAEASIKNQLVLWNQTGGNITLENISGTPVEALGFSSGVYPGGRLAWWRLLDQYGTLQSYDLCGDLASRVNLLTTSDLDNRTMDLSGLIQPHATDQNVLMWIPDAATWPSATLPAVNAVIDPQTTFPGNNLPYPAVGQRYLIVNEIAQTSAAWGPVSADINDIISWNGVNWTRVFDASATSDAQIIENGFSGRWLKWTGDEWIQIPDDFYRPGSWRLML